MEPLRPLFMSSAVTVDVDATFLVQLALFTFFAVLMKDLLFDPLLKVFEQREKRTAGSIDEAREMDEQAIRLKQDYEDKLESIRRDAAADREQVREQVKKLLAELLADARAAQSQRLAEGLSKLAGEVDLIRAELEQHRGPLAAEIASRVLGREVTGREVRR
jgi:F-type H+-transporting ATPase subunit b